jgi:hypothetical protein
MLPKVQSSVLHRMPKSQILHRALFFFFEATRAIGWSRFPDPDELFRAPSSLGLIFDDPRIRAS